RRVAVRIGRVNPRTITDIADAGVVGRKVLGHVQHQRRIGFERSCIGFVTGSMLEENAVAAANRGFTMAPRIPGKSDAWSRVESMTLHTACRCPIHAALD